MICLTNSRFAEVPIDVSELPYGYIPTRYVCYIFVALYTVSTGASSPIVRTLLSSLTVYAVLHFGQAIHRRAWFLLPTAVLAGIGEVIGWGGRLWSSYQPLADDPYMMQYVASLASPARIHHRHRQDGLHDHRSYTSRCCTVHHLRAVVYTPRRAVQSA